MKTALITGGSRGIGEATARLLVKNGYRVAVTYLKNDDAAQALGRETGAAVFPCDTRDEAAVNALGKRILKDFGHLDALVCNAGTAWSGLLQDMTAAQWDDLFAVHVRGAFLTTRAFLPAMISARGGGIVYVSSMWGQAGASCEVAYSACKAALIGMTKALAKEAGPSGVRVNCVAPGVICTDMLKGYAADDLNALREETPLGRLGEPADVARAIAFLLSPQADFITGQTLGVSGGFVI